MGLQFFPDPHRDIFQRRNRQPLDIVQVGMIKDFLDLLDPRLDLVEISRPSENGIWWSLEGDANFKTVPMQAGERLQLVSRLKREFFISLNHRDSKLHAVILGFKRSF